MSLLSGHVGLRYLLAFGSNVGDRFAACSEAVTGLAAAGVSLIACSRILETLPLPGGEGVQASYLNFVAEARSSLSPQDLYQCISSIEDRLGHDRTAKWRPRGMDIDILLVAQEDIGRDGEAQEKMRPFPECSSLPWHEGSLLIPHPGLWSRPFLRELIEGDLGMNLSELRRLHDHAPQPDNFCV